MVECVSPYRVDFSTDKAKFPHFEGQDIRPPSYEIVICYVLSISLFYFQITKVWPTLTARYLTELSLPWSA